MTTKIMALVSRVAGEEESDSPDTSCLVLAAFVRPFDHYMARVQREELARALVGSRNPALEHQRAGALVSEVGQLYKKYRAWIQKRRGADAAEVRRLLREVNTSLVEGYDYLSADRMGRVVGTCPAMVQEAVWLVVSLAREVPAPGVPAEGEGP